MHRPEFAASAEGNRPAAVARVLGGGALPSDAIERLRTTLRAYLAGQDATLEIQRDGRSWTRGSILSSAPEAALAALDQAARAERIELGWLQAESAEPTVQALSRIRNELSGRRES